MKLNLLTNINTATDLEILRQQLLDLENGLFSTKKVDKRYLAKFFTQENYDFFLQDLKENKITISNIKALNTFISSILKHISKLPKVHFTFAIQPVKKTLQEISNYISTTDKKYIVSFSVDPSIYGGTIIMKDGKTFDYSICKSIEPIILKSRLS